MEDDLLPHNKPMPTAEQLEAEQLERAAAAALDDDQVEAPELDDDQVEETPAE